MFEHLVNLKQEAIDMKKEDRENKKWMAASQDPRERCNEWINNLEKECKNHKMNKFKFLSWCESYQRLKL